MSPRGAGDLMEKHTSSGLVFRAGPVSGCTGHAHGAFQLQEPALGILKAPRYSVQHSYAKDALYALGIRSSQKGSRVSRILGSDLAGARAKTQP